MGVWLVWGLAFLGFAAFFKVVVLTFQEIVLVGDKRHQSVPEIGVGGDVHALQKGVEAGPSAEGTNIGLDWNQGAQ